MNPWYKRSLICGIIPLIAGISIFITWYYSREPWLEAAGIINIGIGIVLFLLGLIFLVIYIIKSRRFLRSLLPLFILLLNFPVAITALNTAYRIKSTCTVNIVNQSPYGISNFYLTERDLHNPVADIPPKSISTQEFNFQYEGTVYYSMQVNGKTHQGIIFGYVTGRMPLVATLRLTESGEVTVTTEP